MLRNPDAHVGAADECAFLDVIRIECPRAQPAQPGLQRLLQSGPGLRAGEQFLGPWVAARGLQKALRDLRESWLQDVGECAKLGGVRVIKAHKALQMLKQINIHGGDSTGRGTAYHDAAGAGVAARRGEFSRSFVARCVVVVSPGAARGVQAAGIGSTSMRTRRATKPAAAAAPASVTGRVLIVEPDVLTCWSLATYLGRWYAVDTARSGAAAVRRLRAQPADAVIISDQIRGSAAEAIASAARGGRPNVRLVLLTTDDADTRLARVAVERVEKPFALPELARVLGVAGSES